MRLGIRNIEYIPAQNVRDYSSLPAGSSVNFSDFLLSDLKKLPFTPETGDFLENWLDDENGKYSDFTFSASVRRNKEEYRDLLQMLLRKRHWNVNQSLSLQVHLHIQELLILQE